ncbi:MAG: hypothetical protein ACREAG_08795 [Nitrosopumilaceae archaeon]
MGDDDFTVSVTNSVLTELANNRPWQVGAYIKSVAVYAPAAATSFEFGLFGDGVEIIPRGTNSVGTVPSASPLLEHKEIDYTAFGQWRMPCFHSGAAAQNIRVQVKYEAVVPAITEEAQA